MKTIRQFLAAPFIMIGYIGVAIVMLAAVFAVAIEGGE